jgi:integrase
LAVAELADRYIEFAKGYFIFPDGTPNTHVGHFKQALRVLVAIYADIPVARFGPLALEVVRNEMISKGWSRTYVNNQIQKLKRVFRWGVAQQIVPPDVYAALDAVEGLRRGKSKANESGPVLPVHDAVVDATLPHLSSSVIRSMVELQRLTGARPGEICSMRVGEIDRTSDVWIYRLTQHKTMHRGQQRTIFFGPRAQAILGPALSMKLDAAFVFSPRDAIAEIRERRTAARVTRVRYGNTVGTNRVRKPKKEPGDCYDVSTYRRAIKSACDRAFPVPAEIVNDPAEVRAWRKHHRWHPHQLRHAAATNVRKEFGLEAAQVVLGHASLAASQIYAEKNVEIARKIAAKIG